MLYLVKLDNVYKIGFSDSIETRIKSFETTHVELTQGNNFLNGITNTYIEICQHK